VRDVEDLYDYSVLRRVDEATMFVASTSRPTLVLGGSQSSDVVDPTKLESTSLRRRRGGGGLVLLRPDDLWIDWWIPQHDERWSQDVRVSSVQTGTWWASVLRDVVSGVVTVHERGLEGEAAFRVVCFAGRGPGEVFVDDRKTVGLTQWRVREGVFLSTILHAEATSDVIDFLVAVPDGLSDALDHEALSSLEVADAGALIESLRLVSGPWAIRHVDLNT
jgi:lipoate-protein ligase A